MSKSLVLIRNLLILFLFFLVTSFGISQTQIGQDIYGEASIDGSGHSVSLSSNGTIVAVGARNNDGNGSNSGHVRVYEYDSVSEVWTQMGDDTILNYTVMNLISSVIKFPYPVMVL